MTTIKRYTTSNNSNSGNNTSPKGSMSNPYTVAEYEAIPDEEWKGGYVEGMGYVRPTFEVIGSYPSNAYSDNYSDWLSDWNWGEYSHPFSHMGSTPEPGGGGGNGGNNQNPNTPNPDGQTGGGTQNNNTTSQRVKDLVSKASGFSPEVAITLQELMRQGRIVESNAVQHAGWDDTNRKILLGPYATYRNILHELTHNFQDVGSHSNKEWQAYMMDVVYEIFYDDGGSIHLTGMPLDEYNHYLLFVNDNSGKSEDGSPYVNQAVLDYLNSQNYQKRVNDFIDYAKKNNLPSLYQEEYDPNYNWNWESLFAAMGITIK